MQQQHQGGGGGGGGGGGSQFGAPPPDVGPFSPTVVAATGGPMPLSSRPPSAQPQPQQPRTSYDELAVASGAGGAGAGASGFDDEMMGSAGGGGGGSSGGASSNRWPREETQALIRIRSEMDATFRDATLKGPLWDDVSRKLADLGYTRSAKKCKEKFENVHKYYKRTKEGRAGRQDGKSYRFFEELEALHAAAPQPQPHPQAHPQAPQLQQQQLPPASTAPPLHAFAAPVSAPPPMSSMPPPPGPMQPAPISSAAPAVQVQAPVELPPVVHQPLNLQGFSFSSMSDSESDDESEDDDMTAETGGSQQERLGKRKRGGGGASGASGSKKMMSFFEGLMQQVVDRQEEMQRRFLETMEKREAERTAREEAWRRQEVARLNREQEQLAQERAAGASRDAAIIAFLQRIGAQSVQPATAVVVPMPAPVPVHTPPPPKQPSRQQQHQPPPPPSPKATPQSKPISAAPLQQQPPQQQPKETSQQDAAGTPRSAPPTSGASLELVPVTEHQHQVDSGRGGGGEGGAASSSRWPKTEVHALIQLRMDLDMRYHETGPKGPLWEEISSGMRRLGYNRSSKRCKEKWENINKYYKRVKESNKKRPDDSKTCPYFHQLEVIYTRKHLRAAAAASSAAAAAPAPPAYPDQLNASRHEIEGKNINDDKRNNGGSGGGTQVPASNGETAPTTTPAAFVADTGMKKPEDIVRELNEQPPREFTTEDETDSDDMGDEYTDDGEEGEDDDGKMQYRIQFQRPNPGGTNSAPAPGATTAAPAVPTSAPTSTFLAMVQ